MTRVLVAARVPPAALVALVALVVATGATQVHADVGILPVAGDATVTAAQKQSFEQAIATALGQGRSKKLDKACRADPPDARCLEEAVAGNKDIDEVAAASIARLADGTTHVALRVLTVGDWKTVLALASDIAPGQEVEGAEELVVHAFDPAHYVGSISVDGAPAGSLVFVDGLRAAEPRIALSVGDHQLSVERTDGTPLFAATVHVQFRRDATVHVQASSSAPRIAGFVAPAIAVVGFAALATGASLELFVVHAPGKANDYIGALHAQRNDTVDLLGNKADPQGHAWVGPYGQRASSGVSEPAHFTMTAVAVRDAAAVDAEDSVALALLGAGTAVFVAGAAATADLWLGHVE